MPIYGFQCQACEHSFEVMQKMSDPAPSVCPACGKPSLRKQLSAAGFQLKGSGWYVTDFKGGAKTSTESKSGTESKSSPESKSSTETKSSTENKSSTETKTTPAKGGTDTGPKTGSGSAT